MRRARIFGVIAATAGAVGCTTFTYEGTPSGRLEGQLLVVWVGADDFVYWPAPNDPLRFRVSEATRRKTGVEVLRPGVMYTDGGSIPRPLRALRGFSPWGYAPAYIVHDWIFTAHHCVEHAPAVLNDPKDGAEYAKAAKFDFAASVEVLAEVMKTLMDVDRTVAKDPVAFEAISFGVETPTAERIWDNPDPASCRPVSTAHRAAVEKALAAPPVPAMAPAFARRAAPVGVQAPAVVFRYRFGG